MMNVRGVVRGGAKPDFNPPPQRRAGRLGRPGRRERLESFSGLAHACAGAGRSLSAFAERASSLGLALGQLSALPAEAVRQVWVDDARVDELLARRYIEEYELSAVPFIRSKDDDSCRQARERATSLLLSLLTPEQRDQFTHGGFIEVRGKTTGLTYRVYKGTLFYNVHVLLDGVPHLKLCAAPGGSMPREDKLLGQVMGLKCDERRFIRAANFSPQTTDGFELERALREFARSGL